MKFAHPSWLLLLALLPVLAAAAVLLARLRGRQWSAFIAPRLRGALLRHGGVMARWFALCFLLAACAAMIVAMARPQADAGSTRTEKSLGRNLLIALDISRSMRVADLKPDRLARAKMLIHEMLEAMPNERFGLIGFAGSAYIYAPLTVDLQAVRETVDQIDENWATRGGSNLSAAVRLAIDTLKETGQKNNALLILSDGEHHDDKLDDLIAQARQAGVYVLAIGVGTEDGDYVPNPDFPGGRMVDRQGRTIISRLRPDALRKLANETNGRYAPLGSGTDLTAMVRDTIKDLDAFEIEGRERKVTVEFYQWLVFPALVFLLAAILSATRWRGLTTAIMLAGCFLASPHAHADAVAAAKQALLDKNFTEAQAAYRELADKSKFEDRRARYRLGEATAAYRAGNFRAARQAYSGALLAEDPEVLAPSHLGMGKSLFQLGWILLADSAYPHDPKQTPKLTDFDELVRKKLELATPAGDESGALEDFQSLITNWTDAVRHFESAQQLDPPAKSPANNRTTVLRYLKRLKELLEENKQQTQESLPQPGEGEGEPQAPGEGEPREPGEEGAEGPEKPQAEGQRRPGDQNDQGDEAQPEQGEDGEDSEKPDDKSGKNADQDERDGKSPEDTQESPAERARRILKENADCEKGPLSPGRFEFNPPAKDW